MHDIMFAEKRVKNVKFVYFSRCVWKTFFDRGVFTRGEMSKISRNVKTALLRNKNVGLYDNKKNLIVGVVGGIQYGVRQQVAADMGTKKRFICGFASGMQDDFYRRSDSVDEVVCKGK